MPLLDSDREFFARELDSFVPPRVFTTPTATLYRKAFFSGAGPALVEEFPQMDFHSFQRGIAEITPGRNTSGLFFGWPDPSIDWESNNRFVAEQARLDPNSRAEMLITPANGPRVYP